MPFTSDGDRYQVMFTALDDMVAPDSEARGIDAFVKAGFWWCYINSEAPMPYGEMAKAFPDDELIMEWRRRASGPYADDDEVARWGAGIVWAELHSSGPWRSDYE